MIDATGGRVRGGRAPHAANANRDSVAEPSAPKPPATGERRLSSRRGLAMLELVDEVTDEVLDVDAIHDAIARLLLRHYQRRRETPCS